MNRSLLLLLLGLSIAGNLALGVLATRRPVSQPAAATVSVSTAAAAPAKAQSSSASAAKSTAAGLPETLNSAADLRGMAADLRKAGLPESVVQRVLQAMVSEEFSRRRRAIYDPTAMPYWKNLRPTAEQTKALRALDRERRDMIDALDLPRSPDEIAARRRQFGDLSDAKISALEKVQQDYNELRQDIFEQQRNSSGDRGQNLSAQLKLLEEEQRRDIEALLSPAEKAEYDLRSSETANRLRGQLRALDLNEQEYRTLFAAQKAYDDSRGPDGPRTPEQLQNDVVRWDDLQTAARSALGDERYKQYLISSQLAGRGGEQFFAERPAITVDQIQAIARMNAAIPAEMMREVNAPGLSGEERRARAAAIAKKYQDSLTQLVGADTAKELQARNLVSLPRGLSGGAIGFPAARLPGGP